VQFVVHPIEKKSVTTPAASAPQLIVFEKYVTSLDIISNKENQLDYVNVKVS
jgi:hypothetical protein